MGPENDEVTRRSYPDISVSLDPVEGKNLAGEAESATTTEDPVRTPGETSKGTEVLDETHQFDFGRIAAGVYELDLTDGWRARLGPKDATEMVGDALNPLADNVMLDVTPTTTTVYGYVRDSDDFPVEDVTVTVNGVAATSDVHGRYIAEYVPTATRTIRGMNSNRPITNSVFVETDHEGSGKTLNIKPFAANSRIMQDVDLSGVGKTASISGTVTASGSGDPIAGVQIMAEGLTNFNAKIPPTAARNNALVTGADGSYTAVIEAKDLGESVDVSVSKDGMSFAPAQLSVPAHAGSAVSGINFTGFLHATISGRVKDPDGRALGGVEVTATNVIEGQAGDEASSTTNARGTFVLSVPFGTYTVAASKVNYSFGYPLSGQTRSVAPGQTVDFGDIQAMTFAARSLTVSRDKNDDGNYPGTVTLKYVFDSPDAFSAPTHTIQTCTADCDEADATWTDVTLTDDPEVDDDPDTDATEIEGTIPADDARTDSAISVRITSTATEEVDDGQGGTNTENRADTTDVEMVAAVDPTPSEAAAVRGVRDPDGTPVDTLGVSWTASTNSRTAQRVVIRVEVAEGQHEWLVAVGTTPATVGSDTRAWSLDITGFSATAWARADGTGSSNVTEAALLKALMVRVETQQPGVTQDDDDMDIWVESDAVEVAAKPSS